MFSQFFHPLVATLLLNKQSIIILHNLHSTRKWEMKLNACRQWSWLSAKMETRVLCHLCRWFLRASPGSTKNNPINNVAPRPEMSRITLGNSICHHCLLIYWWFLHQKKRDRVVIRQRMYRMHRGVYSSSSNYQVAQTSSISHITHLSLLQVTIPQHLGIYLWPSIAPLESQ